jgi:hypothetical protein
MIRDRGRFFRFLSQSCFVIGKIPGFAEPKETDIPRKSQVDLGNRRAPD